ncbi:MAG: hypothetical protein N2448_00550 [Caloramator sp.]|nr:hypothetical protein [Caloramator sp.]
MKIKKQLKKEEIKWKRTIAISIAIAILMPYMVYVLNGEDIFVGWEIYFAYFYAGFVDLLVFINILRTLSDSKFSYIINNQKIKIKDSIFASPVSINLNKIVYVDVSERPQKDFEVLLIMDKGKRKRGFFEFDSSFVKMRSAYKNTYNYLHERYSGRKLFCYTVKKGGSKKYHMLYVLYKNCYEAQFSQRAIEYIKTFIEEYNLS